MRLADNGIMRSTCAVLALMACTSLSANAPPASDDVVDGCFVAMMCDVFFAWTVNDCVSNFWRNGLSTLAPQELHCLATAGNDCARARACVGQSVTTVASCPAGQYSCNGTNLVDCNLGSALEVDCRRWLAYGATGQNGMFWLGGDSQATCMAGSQGGACAIGSCLAGAPDSCDGDRMLRCRDGFTVAIDCSQLGFTCGLRSNGSTVACTGHGAACVGDRSRCDGDAIIHCVGDHEERRNCKDELAGSHCVVNSAAGDFAYCGFDTQCVPYMGLMTQDCNGNVLSVCAFGVPRTFDCVALGFQACSDASGRCM